MRCSGLTSSRKGHLDIYSDTKKLFYTLRHVRATGLEMLNRFHRRIRSRWRDEYDEPGHGVSRLNKAQDLTLLETHSS